MRIAIDRNTLKRHRACRAAYNSPEWDAGLDAIVFSDWDATVKRFMSTPEGEVHLEWYVRHKLVPMTLDEFKALKAGSK